jgi:hypothetical protein
MSHKLEGVTHIMEDIYNILNNQVTYSNEY